MLVAKRIERESYVGISIKGNKINETREKFNDEQEKENHRVVEFSPVQPCPSSACNKIDKRSPRA